MPSELKINAQEFVLMMDQYISEQDPVDGVITTLQETYDKEQKGKISKEDMFKFMESQKWLGGDKDTIIKILEG